MPLVLSLKCENHAECGQRIDSDEALDLAPAPYRIGLDGSDRVIYGGEGVEVDLYAAAKGAGWYWTGAWWLCPGCHGLAEVRKEIAAQNRTQKLYLSGS